MFPGVVMLDVSQVATLLRCAKGHLYNLSSTDRLPFKLSVDVGNRFLISIVEIAAYMDKAMLTEGAPPLTPAEPLVVSKRKPGRPKGSTAKAKSQKVMAFQSELMHLLGVSHSSEIAELAQSQPCVPFFADAAGCIIAMPLSADGWALEDQKKPEQVLWLSWAQGLAAVWQDETMRQIWLQKADLSGSGLRQQADSIRRTHLSSI